MRYYKGYMALSEACDVPVLLHIRNARAICFDQLSELISFEMEKALSRSLRWRVARLEKAGLLSRLDIYRYLGKPVFGITQQGLECLEARGHYLLSLPSNTEQILHSSQVPHALELVNIRIALAKAGLLISWKSELEITSRNLIVESMATKDYDAVAEIEFEGNSRRLAIEYERNPKAAHRYRAIRDVLDKDETADTVLYLTANDDILYLLAVEMRSCRRQIGFALSEAFRRSLLETRTLTNTEDSEVVLLRDLLRAKRP
ncbi:replication-relaxation family protein [Acidicapsa ligni]|uniref:replication-relaxation family protein n=1 Tax=Acidicapsa ligni TaxID=542300 RepID=UPI0021E0A94E|nr:replication-relaxation family protein [Acidicapsa ligni]